MFNLSDKKRIVIKVGSTLLVEKGKVRVDWLDSLVQDIKSLKELGLEVVIVSSGAIALGKHYLKVKSDKLNLQEKQAAAAVGQIELMSFYKNYFAEYDLNVAQILLTGGESNNRDRYLNARNTLDTLLKNDVIPIVNENDSVVTEEIKIGDNDRLAARVVQMISAELLILFSDVDGLYDKDPQSNKDAKFIDIVENVTKEIENMACGPVSDSGTGGMIVKIKAAKMAFNSGCNTVIAKGLISNPIKNLLNGGKYTLFRSGSKKISSRKNWIVDGLNPKGEIIINKCAVEALSKGSSLLPVGVEKVTGDFVKGDQILIKDEEGSHIATGLISYSIDDAKLIIGKKTAEIKEILKKSSKEELVHRDNMVVL